MIRRDTLVAARDLAIFCLKLVIDGTKDVVLVWGALIAFGLDIVLRRRGRRRLFYGVMRAGERFDLWLNLHGAIERLDRTPGADDGLFGASEAGTDTLLGKLEELTRGGDEPRGRR